MKQEKLLIYGKHAVHSAINNSNRNIDEIILIKNNLELRNATKQLLKNTNRKTKIKYVENKFMENILHRNSKHQGIIAKSYKLKIDDYTSIFEKKYADNNFKHGVILDRLTDPNNIGAIYRSAKAFGINFVINTDKHSIIENSSLLNAACGAFDNIFSFKANNISNAIKSFKSKDWWIIGLEHSAKLNIEEALSKMSKNDKFIFVLGSEGKGIRRLVKKNCNYLASIPNVPNTNSINVSNAAAVTFYEFFKFYFKKS